MNEMAPEKPRRKLAKRQRRVRPITAELLEAARETMRLWTRAESSQIGVLRGLKSEIELMLERGARQSDVRNELWKLGIDLAPGVFKDYFRERAAAREKQS